MTRPPTLGDLTGLLKRSHEEEFHVERARALGGPIVYAWVRGNDVLYVGLGAYGISRPLSRTHHKLIGMEPGDRIVVWCFETATQAALVEKDLILALRPPLNGTHIPVIRKPKGAPQTPAPPPKPLELLKEETWMTVEETAEILRRAPKTIRNLICKHELSRRIIHQGRSRRRVMLLSYRTREQLREICWGPIPDEDR